MRRIIAAAVCCLVSLGGVAAQTAVPLQLPTERPTLTATLTPTATFTASSTPSETPPPTETLDPNVTVGPLNLTVTYDVLFPAGIGFHLAFRTPSTRIESITFTAAQDGWAGETRNISLDGVVLDSGGESHLFYLWTLAQDPPTMLVPVTLTWTVVPRGGEAETVEVEAVWADPRFRWVAAEADGAPITVAVPDGRTSLSIALAQSDILAEILAFAGRDIAPLKAMIFPASASPNPCPVGDDSSVLRGENTGIGGMTADCSLAAALEAYDVQGWTPLHATSTTPIQFVLTDAIIKAAYPGLFDGDAPAWFKYGIVAYLSGLYSTNDLATVRAASRSNQFFPLENEPTTDAQRRDWGQQSTGIVLYMASRVGLPSMLDVLDQLDAGESLAEVWTTTTGQLLSAVNPAWRSWIFTPQGEAAYGALPSLAPTATLVPTRTMTPSLTPTLTSTPTSTLTPTETPTETPLPSDTPLFAPFVPATAAPTATPTVTPPPTLTARPAEPFALGPLPTATPLNATQNSPQTVAIAAGAGLVIALILIGAIVFMIRRR